MDEQKAAELLDKYNKGQCTEQEKAWLETWYLRDNQELPHELSKKRVAEATDRIWNRLNQETETVGIRSLWPRLAAAASILLLLGAGGYLLLKSRQPPVQVAQLIKNDIPPGHNQATLILANGKKILLTKGLKGQLAIQNGTTISAGGHDIIYNSEKSQVFSYNTLATARGEQSPYPLVLADGTKVWLNAESSLTFPTAFNGTERVVKLTGEAYFEVNHNAAQPFKVETEKQTIEDIGTAFDVQAYRDEPKSRTTLLEGTVKVNGQLLRPGQQSDGSKVTSGDVADAVAWKNGLIRFDNVDVPTLMRQIARWYAITVVYEGPMNRYAFAGEIRRNTNLSNVLRILAEGGVHCELKDRTLIIQP